MADLVFSPIPRRLAKCVDKPPRKRAEAAETHLSSNVSERLLAVGHALGDAVTAQLRALGARVETGKFGADMKVSLVNDGPITIIIEL